MDRTRSAHGKCGPQLLLVPGRTNANSDHFDRIAELFADADCFLERDRIEGVNDVWNVVNLNTAKVAAGDNLLVRVGNTLGRNDNLHGDECAAAFGVARSTLP